MTDPRVAPQAARFGDVADRYERARPLYPDAALSELAARCGLRSGTGVVDLGAGTGKLTRQVRRHRRRRRRGRAGWLALLWNERPASGWAAELWDLRAQLTGGTRVYPGDGWAEVLAADERFGPRTSSHHDVAVKTTVAAELADSESRSCVHVVDEPRRREVLERLHRFLETHPETAGRRHLTYTRPCTLHLCQRLA